MARLSTELRPARLLERLGMPEAAVRARILRVDASFYADSLRRSGIVRPARGWLRERRGRSAYRVLSEEELRATRRSDTAFVFGSSRSLLEIELHEWERIAEHDTIGFSHFHRQRWVRVDYHVVAEVSDVEETAASIRASPFYADTVFAVVGGPFAEAGNELVGRRLLPDGARIFRWHRTARGLTVPPSRRFARGLVHGSNTSLDVTNFALLAGWKRIVLVGVDLYDRGFFWLPEGVARPDERTTLAVDSPFPSAEHVVEMFDLWSRTVRRDGVELLVYNPRSLLARVLPVFGR